MEEEAFNEYLSSVNNELSLIKEQSQHRQILYKKCLNNYLASLNEQTQMFEKSKPNVEKHHDTIRTAFETVYNSILHGSDVTMRHMRHTFDRKKRFWSETLLQYASDPSLELKTFLHEQRDEALQLFNDAVDARRELGKTSYRTLVKQKTRSNALAQYTRSNYELQNNVLRGGMNTLDKWKALHQVSYNDKQNEFGTQNQTNDMRSSKKEQEYSSRGVIHHFIKKI